MSRINTNIPSLVAQRVLNTNNSALNTSLNRLSTGLRINSGRDDPAGLIASEELRAEKRAINAAITNIARANNVIGTAEGGLVEVNKLLTDLEDLIDRSSSEASISEDERDANQLQIDSILASIDRFANTTQFQGRRLLSGELDYTTSGVVDTNLAGIQINAASVPNDGYRTVTIDVVTSAEVAAIDYTGSTTSGGTVTIEVVGNLGTEVVTFGSGTTVAEMALAINQSTLLTGVSAATSGGDSLLLRSTDYGSTQYVQVNIIDDSTTGGGSDFTANINGGGSSTHQEYGVDANVKINGATAITDGLKASVRTTVLSVDLELTAAFGAGAAAGTTTFDITGGGADFMLSPSVSFSGLASIGLPSVTTSNLGLTGSDVLSSLATGKANALASGNYSTAQQIVRAAQDQVSFLRGRLGAFQKDTLATTSNALSVTYENIAAAESVIRETDFAAETAALTRSQILVQAATNTLRIANANPQNVLALLS